MLVMLGAQAERLARPTVARAGCAEDCGTALEATTPCPHLAGQGSCTGSHTHHAWAAVLQLCQCPGMGSWAYLVPGSDPHSSPAAASTGVPINRKEGGS